MSSIDRNMLKQFEEEGYLITEPQWDKGTLLKVQNIFDRLLKETIDKAQKELKDKQYINLLTNRAFIGKAHTQDPFLAEFVKSEIYLEACRKFIGKDANLYYNQAVIKAPKVGHHFTWHQDSGYKKTNPLEYITCWTPINDTTIENGCIWIIPRSHKGGLVEHSWDDENQSWIIDVDQDKAIPVEVEAGQVVIFSSLLFHSSGKNRSSETRYAYVPQYHVNHVTIESDSNYSDNYPIIRENKKVT